MMINRSFEGVAASPGAAIIERKDYVAPFRKDFVPEVGWAAPGVADYLNVRAAVDTDQDGIFFCGVEIQGLDDGCVQFCAVVCLDFDKFYRRQAVVREF